MELKLFFARHADSAAYLLIELYGIEIIRFPPSRYKLRLLIELYGIEMAYLLVKSQLFNLLIELYGIEIYW